MTEGMGDDDEQLLAAAASGDGAAFGVLYRRHLPVVLRWCLRQTGNREVAADLAAETFAAALTSARRYRPEQGAVLAWLLGIARNKLLEGLRRGRVADTARKRLRLEPEQLTDADLERVEELASLNEEVLARLQGLPPALRDALTDRVIAERSYEEIASKLRCSESVVRQRVSRALRTLRSQVEEP
ncbi:MAG TPA: RNA polymerase sigma factor [Solirubrobacteraceae bacterium]|jgi:RNA polymerase sigma-70 factor (ECF subfamily)